MVLKVAKRSATQHYSFWIHKSSVSHIALAQRACFDHQPHRHGVSKLQISRDHLLALASSERILTVRRLRAQGISTTVQTRLARHELIYPVGDGFFSVGPPTWLGYIEAALHIGKAEAAAYGTTALALHGMAEHELPVHIITPRTTQPRSRSWVTFHRSDLATRQLLDHHELRRIGFEDSIVDALGQVDETGAIALLTRSIQERRTTAQRLLEIVNSRSRVAHRSIVLKILRDGAGIESALEHAYVTRVESPHGLEPMQRQFIVPETGHRADGAYPERRALVHLDGARYHDPEVDRLLDLQHGAFRYSSSRITWSDCWIRPCTTARIMAGGPLPRRCRRCPDR